MYQWIRNVQFRGKQRLLEPLCPKHGIRVANVYGSSVHLDLADLVQRHIYLGTYEPRQTSVFKSRLKPGSTVVDVGANVGYFTLLASSLVGDKGHVTAIEPNPSAYALLANSVKENQLTNVRLIQCALSDAPGEALLYVPPVEHHNNNATLVPVDTFAPVRVPLNTLDRVISDANIKNIDILKIDVEGHEEAVLKGAASALHAGMVRAVVIEFNGYWLGCVGSSPARLHRLLQDHGFRCDEWPPTRPFRANCLVTLLFTRDAGTH